MDSLGPLESLSHGLRALLDSLGVDVAKFEAYTGLDFDYVVLGTSALSLTVLALGFVSLLRSRKGATSHDSPSEPVESDASAIERGLTKTRSGFLEKLNEILFRGKIDEELIEDLESLLITSDIGIQTTEKLLDELRSEVTKEELKDVENVKNRLKQQIEKILGETPEAWSFDVKPKVIMVVGVNGVGKTTTIGKLAARYKKMGKKVMLGAGDTFRAAAAEQLEVWGERADAEVIRAEEGSDPASVLFQAVEKAKAADVDILFCDTAGRLHTKANLMKELTKVNRVIGKAMDGAPHDILMVLDATTGQNAITQARQFTETVDVGSIALTKLDGTAKGGVVVAIRDQLKVPVRFIGVGESVEDLRDFDSQAFVSGLFDGTTHKSHS